MNTTLVKEKKLSQDERNKMVLQILSLQVDLNVPRGNMNQLVKMPDNWLKDCLTQLQEADDVKVSN